MLNTKNYNKLTISRIGNELHGLNSESSIKTLVYLRENKLPIKNAYLNGKQMVDKLDGLLSNDILTRRQLSRLMNLQLQTSDASLFEVTWASDNHYNLIKLLKSGFNEILRLLIDKEISYHNFVSNIPLINLNDNPEDVIKYLREIINYNDENRYQCLRFMNYKKVRYSKNLSERLQHISVVQAARVGVSGKEEEAYTPISYIKGDHKLAFTKEPSIVGTIGEETLCCFTPNGLAGPLIDVALKSPISGILHGYMDNRRWFSFVWDIVTYNEDTNSFDRSLILDNIEAKGRIVNYDDLMEGLETISRYYKNIYVGTERNDIDLPRKYMDEIINKPYNLVGYENSFSTTYDDSKRLLPLIKGEVNENINVRRMDKGDLHYCKYIEKLVYQNDADSDFLDINVHHSPSYIVDSRTSMFGYFLTRLKYYEKGDTGYRQYRDIPMSEVKNIKEDNIANGRDELNGLQKILYIEDLVMTEYKNVKYSLKYIIDDLKEWCEQNDISVIVSNLNNNSKFFNKRLSNSGLKYVDQSGHFPYNVDLDNNILRSYKGRLQLSRVENKL